jgi:hypothetical protein
MNLNEWSQAAIEQAARNIGAFRTVNGKRRRISSSGQLKSSLGFTIAESADGDILIKFTSSMFYAAFVQQGVNGTEVPQGSPFSFKEGTKMIPVGDASESWGIRKWMKDKPIRLRDPNTGEFVPAMKEIERGKRKGQMMDMKQKAAFGIARSIKRRGIVPMPFMTEGINDLIDKLPSAIGVTIEAKLDNMLKQ